MAAYPKFSIKEVIEKIKVAHFSINQLYDEPIIFEEVMRNKNKSGVLTNQFPITINNQGESL